MTQRHRGTERTLWAVSVALWLCVTSAAPLAAEVKVLKNFTLIDGTGGPSRPGMALVITDGRISWVGPSSGVKAPAESEAVDLTGKFVMPGIINLHGHLGVVNDLTQDAKFFTRENIEKNLRTYATYGVTGVVSMGTDQDLIFPIRDAQRTGRPAMTRIFTAGQGFLLQSGYGGIAGVANSVVTSVSEVAPKVAAQAAKKVDLIKLWMDDHLGQFPKRMPYDVADAIIAAAHKHKLRVAAHVFYMEDAKHLVDAGVDGLAHMVRNKPADQALIQAMKRRGTWQIAGTLAREAGMFAYAEPERFLNDAFFMKGISPRVAEGLRTDYRQRLQSDPHFAEYPGILESAKRNLKALVDGGVKFGFGTDSGPAGRFPGFSEHWEMELMVSAGLSPMQAIVAATRSAAEFLGRTDLGTLEVKKWADVVVLDKDPLQDIQNTRTIQAVYIAGNKVQ